MTSRLVIGLIVSATLNVFLVGGVAGVAITGARLTPPSAAQRLKPPPNLWVAAGALPQPERLRFRAMLRNRAEAVQPQLQAVRADRREAAALMTAPRLDGKAIAAALERARSGEMAARGAFDQAFVDYLATMPQPERAALASAMVRAAPRTVRAAMDRDDGGAATPSPAGPAKP